MLWLLMFVYIGTGDSVYIISVAENVLQLVCVDGVCLIKCARDHTLFVINHQIGEVFHLWYALASYPGPLTECFEKKRRHTV